MDEMYGIIKNLADNYSQCLSFQIENRTKEMLTDDISHYLIYEVLGITSIEGKLIDLYQNKGRFLYKYAGAFLEEATIACFQYKHKNAEKVKIPNTLGIKPKTFEIDCLIGNEAHEIKWRDATTDGDHITKEHTRIQAIKENGYIPIRVMFYYPQREQAIKIQSILQTLYEGVGGKYYAGNNAWEYVHTYTGINLLKILENIANTRRNHVIQ